MGAGCQGPDALWFLGAQPHSPKPSPGAHTLPGVGQNWVLCPLTMHASHSLSPTTLLGYCHPIL